MLNFKNGDLVRALLVNIQLWLTDGRIDWLTDDGPTDWLTDRRTDGWTDCRVDWRTNKLANWLKDGRRDWLAVWLPEGLTVNLLNVYLAVYLINPFFIDDIL